MKIKNFEAVYPFRGYVTEKVTCTGIGIQIDLRWDARRKRACPSCGCKMAKNRERKKTAFDLACGNGPVTLITYPSIQGRCSGCGSYSTIIPDEIHPTKRATWRLMRYVSMLARFVPLDGMKAICEVPAATAWRYDKAVLEADLPEPKLDGIRALLVDEKSVRKGHRYVTVVLDADTGELLHLHEGKKRASLAAFFDKLSASQKASIKAVCVDRNGAYRSAIEEQLPEADIVFDRFHLMANLAKAIDQLRREEIKAASEEDKRVIKGQRYNLLRNPENLTGKQSLCLRNLLAMNEKLSTAYILKGQFRLTWTYSTPGWARRFLKDWVVLVRESGIDPLVRFANGVERDIEGIVSWCRHHLSNGLIESFNSTISRIIFKARGIRSLDYLYLKLRQESLLQI